MSRVRKAVIPAAGLGTRFLPASKAVPKEMLPIVDKPVIQYIVEGAVESGIEEVVRLLDGHGYGRWLVLEQDTAITGQEPPAGDGPVLDVRKSIEYLSTLAPEREVAQP